MPNSGGIFSCASNGRYGGGGSISGRYDLVFRNHYMHYQQIYLRVDVIGGGGGGSNNNSI